MCATSTILKDTLQLRCKPLLGQNKAGPVSRPKFRVSDEWLVLRVGVAKAGGSQYPQVLRRVSSIVPDDLGATPKMTLL